MSGTATCIGQEHQDGHPHILRLSTQPTILDVAIRCAANWLPSFARKWLQRFLPGPFLPPTVIIKKLKPTWDAEFDHEKSIYQKLKPLQGHVIPILYGEGSCDGTRALVLSDVGGVSLYGDQVRCLSESRIKEMLRPALRAILSMGVEPGDENPRNFHLVEDRIFILDFEDTAPVNPSRVDELEEAVAEAVAHWTVFYHKNNS
jgi:hypothetical protein